MKKFLGDLQKVLFVFLIVGAPLSKYPSISTPAFDFTSFRVGFYQIALCIFVALSLPQVIRRLAKRKLDKKDELVFGVCGLLITTALFGLNRAENLNRSLLMFASFSLLILALISGYHFVKNNLYDRSKIIRYMLIAGVGYGAVSAVQLIIGTFVSTDEILLCSGCGSDVFGFPRISGFAAEPLFWANAVLPFFVVACTTYIKDKSRLALYSLVATSFTIAVTFARGAFLAVAVIVGIDLIWRVTGKKSINVRSLLLVFGGAMAGFMMLVASASIRYSEAPYITYNTARGMVEHLSLGAINLPIKTDIRPVLDSLAEPAPANPDEVFVSEGLVEASSDDRLGAAKLALEAWRKPSNWPFGVGLGNLGPYIVTNVDSNAPSNLTVYIFYVLFLVEMGAVGLLLLLALYGSAIRRLYRQNNVNARMVLLILIGFLVQYVFFGSYINVTYIWLWLGIGLGMGVELGNKHDKSVKTKRATISKV